MVDTLKDFRAYLQNHRDEMMHVLRMWDEDNDGQISRKEFRQACSALAIKYNAEHDTELGREVSREEVDELYDEVDNLTRREISRG